MPSQGMFTSFSNAADERSQRWVMGISVAIMAIAWAVAGFSTQLVPIFWVHTLILQLPMILIGVLCEGLLFTSIATIAHSLCFWFGNIGEVSKKYVDSIFLFVHYPVNIYSGFMQIFMFTILPAGLIGYLPVEIVKRFSWSMLLVLVGTTGIFVALAFFVFYRGLRRYESGNLFLT